MKKNLIIRMASGLVYIGILLGCYFGGIMSFASLTMLLAFLAYEESTSIVYGPIRWRNSLLPLIDLATLASVVLAIGDIIMIWIPVLLICVRVVAQIYVKTESPARRLAISFLQILYLGIGLGTMLEMAETGKVVLAVLILIWLNDTGAYLFGTLMGRHKLFERISPKKTWEGFIGGMSVSVAAAIIFSLYLNNWFEFIPSGNMWMWIVLALSTVAFSTWGDLIESLIKRNMNIKDSGNLIPGHGGILDRIDSLLLAMPAAWCLLRIFDIV